MIVAVNKCNITKFALSKLTSLHYGVKCDDYSCAILENYMQHLNCTSFQPCYPDPVCNAGNPIYFDCDFNILSISATLNPPGGGTEDVIFDLQVGDYVGGKEPFTYSWSWDEDIFDLIGEDDQPQIRLQLKEGKQIEHIVTFIEVIVTDADGCRDSKMCWLTPDGVMHCNPNFVPCNNPENLQVIYDYVECSAPSMLEVNPS